MDLITLTAALKAAEKDKDKLEALVAIVPLMVDAIMVNTEGILTNSDSILKSAEDLKSFKQSIQTLNGRTTRMRR